MDVRRPKGSEVKVPFPHAFIEKALISIGGANLVVKGGVYEKKNFEDIIKQAYQKKQGYQAQAGEVTTKLTKEINQISVDLGRTYFIFEIKQPKQGKYEISLFQLLQLVYEKGIKISVSEKESKQTAELTLSDLHLDKNKVMWLAIISGYGGEKKEEEKKKEREKFKVGRYQQGGYTRNSEAFSSTASFNDPFFMEQYQTRSPYTQHISVHNPYLFLDYRKSNPFYTIHFRYKLSKIREKKDPKSLPFEANVVLGEIIYPSEEKRIELVNSLYKELLKEEDEHEIYKKLIHMIPFLSIPEGCQEAEADSRLMKLFSSKFNQLSDRGDLVVHALTLWPKSQQRFKKIQSRDNLLLAASLSPSSDGEADTPMKEKSGDEDKEPQSPRSSRLVIPITPLRDYESSEEEGDSPAPKSPRRSAPALFSRIFSKPLSLAARFKDWYQNRATKWQKRGVQLVGILVILGFLALMASGIGAAAGLGFLGVGGLVGGFMATGIAGPMMGVLADAGMVVAGVIGFALQALFDVIVAACAIKASSYVVNKVIPRSSHNAITEGLGSRSINSARHSPQTSFNETSDEVSSHLPASASAPAITSTSTSDPDPFKNTSKRTRSRSGSG